MHRTESECRERGVTIANEIAGHLVTRTGLTELLGTAAHGLAAGPFFYLISA